MSHYKSDCCWRALNCVCVCVHVSTKRGLVSILTVRLTVGPFRRPAQNIKQSFLMLIRNHTKHFGSFSIKHWIIISFCKFCIFYIIFVANPRQKMAHCGGMIGGEKPAIPGLSPSLPFTLILSFSWTSPLPWSLQSWIKLKNKTLPKTHQAQALQNQTL